MRTLVLLLTVALALACPGLATAMPHRNMQDSAAELDREFVPFFGIQTWAENSQRGCTTKFISENFSSRNGATAQMNVGHFTVSRNVAGWDDVWVIRNLFNRDNFNASSNYVIDAEGHCAYIVPEGSKAWTQGNMNPWSISVEFVAMGNESKAWWDNAGLRKMALVFADSSKRWNIPIRLVNPVGCNPTPGITDHLRLECGNSHTDLGPNFPWGLFMELVRRAADPPETIPTRSGVWNGDDVISKVEWQAARWYLGLSEYDKWGRQAEEVRPDVPRRFNRDAWAAVRWYTTNVVLVRRAEDQVPTVEGEFLDNDKISPREWQAARWFLGLSEYAEFGAWNATVRPRVPKAFTDDAWSAVRWYRNHIGG